MEPQLEDVVRCTQPVVPSNSVAASMVESAPWAECDPPILSASPATALEIQAQRQLSLEVASQEGVSPSDAASTVAESPG